MNVQNNGNVNFKATRVLIAKRISKKVNTSEVIDIFMLNHNQDMEFVRTCYESLEQNQKKLRPEMKKLKEFFKNFITDAKTQSEDYTIAIKNGEQIVGGCEYFPFDKDLFVNKAFSTIRDKIVGDSLLYALLADARKTYGNKAIYGTDIKKFFNMDTKQISKTELKDTMVLTNKNNPSIKFKTVNEEGMNLAQFLDLV